MTWEELQAAIATAKAAGDTTKVESLLMDYATGANTRIEGLNGEAAKHRKTAAERATELEKFAGIDPTKVKELQNQASQIEQDRLKQEGKFDEALKEAIAGKDTEITSLKTMLQDKDKSLETFTVDNAFLAGIDGRAVNNAQVLALARGNIKIEEGKPVVYEGDKVKLNKKGERVSLAEYGIEFLAENPHLAKGAGTPGSGSHNNNIDNGAGKTTIGAGEIGDNLEAVAKGDTVVQ